MPDYGFGDYGDGFFGEGAPLSTSIMRISLEPATAPSLQVDHSIWVRARVTDADEYGTIRATLYQGATPIGSELETPALSVSFADYQLEIADVDAATISDYSNLEVRLQGWADEGDTTTFEVSEVWLAIPAVVVTDSATVPLRLTPSGVELREISDAATVPLDLSTSGTDQAQFVETANVYLDIQSSGTEEHVGGVTEYQDTATVPLDLSVVSDEVAVFSDAQTILVDLQSSGVEFREITDTATVPFDLQSSGIEFREITDTGSIYMDLQSSGTELREITDADTILVDLQSSGTDEAQFADATTVPLDLLPSGTEFLEGPGAVEYSDVATIYVDITVPVPQIILSDTFTRSVVDGWGNADTGQLYVNAGSSAAESDVDGSRGLFSPTASGRTGAQKVDVGFPDVALTFTWTFENNWVTNGNRIQVTLRQNLAGSEGYYVRLEHGTSNRIQMNVFRIVGSVTIGGTITIVPANYVLGTQYTTRFEVIGSRVRAKTWQTGTVEPAWQIDVEDTAGTPAALTRTWASFAGIRFSSVAAVMTIDDVSVLSPGIEEIAEFVDADTVMVLLTPDTQDIIVPVDSATVYLNLQASGTSVRETTDVTTVPLDLSVTTVDIAQLVEAATIGLILTPATVEIMAAVDASMVYLDIQPGFIRVEVTCVLEIMGCVARFYINIPMVQKRFAIMEVRRFQWKSS